MSVLHERPGVYSDYQVSSLLSAAAGAKTVAVAAVAGGEAAAPVAMTSYGEALAAFGSDSSMGRLLLSLYKNGAGTVIAAAVAAEGEGRYQTAFTALSDVDGIAVMVCDSTDLSVQSQLKAAAEAASAERRERIAVVEMGEATVSQLVERAAALNSERVVLLAPQALGSGGEAAPAGVLSAAVAAVIAAQTDPALPLGGAEILGFTGVSCRYDDSSVDSLVRGGVTPVDCAGGAVSIVRAVTTRTTTSGAADATWRELSTILIADDVIPALRSALRAKFTRSKNNAQTRAAIRTQVILELENRLEREIIDSYNSVSVSADAQDPTVCVVEFGFGVTHGLSRIYLTAHITV